MNWENTSFVWWAMVATTAAAIFLALYGWRARQVPGTLAFALAMAAGGIWTAATLGELSATDLPTKMFWVKVEYLGIVSLPLAWFTFAVQHTGRGLIPRRILAVAAAEPAMVVILAWTNEVHGLIWSRTWLDESGPSPMFAATYGPWFWVHTAYCYSLILAATVLFLQTSLRTRRPYLQQSIALMVAPLAPWVANITYVFRLGPAPHMDLTPVGFVIAGLILGWGVFRIRILDAFLGLTPLARDAIFDDMIDGVVVLDAHDRVVDINPAAQRLLGQPGKGAIGQPPPVVLQAYREITGGSGEAAEKRAEILLGEGADHRYHDLLVSRLHDRRGHLVGHLLVMRDITERKRVEDERDALLARQQEINRSLLAATEEARRTADELDASLNSMANGVLISDREGRIVRINPVAQRILGYTAEDLRLPFPERLSRLPFELTTTDGELLPTEMMPIIRALHGEPVYDLPLGLRRDSKTTWVSICAAPVRSARGELLGAVVTIVDTTSQHEFQERREDLLRAVSHDLRTPLTVVLARAQMLRQMFGKPEKVHLVAESADAIVAAGGRMLATIQDMSDMVRAESGQLVVSKERVDLRPILANPAALVGSEAANRITVEVPPSTPEVIANRHYVERILTNLLTNALKYSEPGSEVVVRAEMQGSDMSISVVDQGRGIDQEHLPHLFERFYRAPGSREMQGVGLGLYIARILTEALGGRIWVESELGKGSTFTFTLPMDTVGRASA